MKVLLGIIEKEAGEQLFVLEKGKGFLMPAEHAQEEFGNYKLLKERPLLINNHPVSGAGVFKFRYGPVTSGIREAGCYTLYTYGEKILRVTIDLNWKHRKIEEAMKNKTPDEGLQLAEAFCSNFGLSHSVAFCRAAEEALQLPVSLQARNWRILLLEMERVYNHLHVIYKLASAAAQKVLAAHLSILYEQALRLNQIVTGSRFLMHINKLAGLDHLPDLNSIEHAIMGYQQLERQFRELYEHSLNNPNYLDRLHGSGTLTPEQALGFGLTGPSLRACGMNDELNGTHEHFIGLPVVTQNEGDALARMETRSEELVNSCQYLVNHLKVSDTWQEEPASYSLQTDTSGEGCGVAHSPSGAVGYHICITGGMIQQLYAFTPSYAGMHAIATSLQDQVFTDFPFVVDSFGVHFTDASG
jgi:Ni,Fe-hydrogenase III large subunit